MTLPDIQVERRYNVVNATTHGISILYSPLTILLLLLSPDWWEALKEGMNAHLEGLRMAPITISDLKHYFGIYLRMCCIKLRFQSDHWKAQHKHPRMMPRHFWEHIHRHRAFSVLTLQSILNRNVKLYVNPGTEINVDELQSNFSGDTPCGNFNNNKPHPWGHLFWIAAVRILLATGIARSYIYNVCVRIPEYTPSTHKLMRDICSVLPPSEIN